MAQLTNSPGIDLSVSTRIAFNRNMIENDLPYRLDRVVGGDWVLRDGDEDVFEFLAYKSLIELDLSESEAEPLLVSIATAFVAGTQWGITKTKLGAA